MGNLFIAILQYSVRCETRRCPLVIFICYIVCTKKFVSTAIRDVNEARHLEAKAEAEARGPMPRPRPRPKSSRPRPRSRPEFRGQGRERGRNSVQKYHGPKTTTNNTQFVNLKVTEHFIEFIPDCPDYLNSPSQPLFNSIQEIL